MNWCETQALVMGKTIYFFLSLTFRVRSHRFQLETFLGECGFAPPFLSFGLGFLPTTPYLANISESADNVCAVMFDEGSLCLYDRAREIISQLMDLCDRVWAATDHAEHERTGVPQDRMDLHEPRAEYGDGLSPEEESVRIGNHDCIRRSDGRATRRHGTDGKDQ
jgi:hypothetical protein